ncbi:MAG: hypothetical protein Q4B26_19165, partial [Eubacteriales bacterium]|nr:hypothetical protein [Eubacteriales bacterium]
EKKSKEKKRVVYSYTPDQATNITRIIDAYTRICVDLIQIGAITEAKKAKIAERLKTYSVDDIEIAFMKSQESDLLTARKGTWKATFDWIMNSDENIKKILSGNYDNWKQQTNKNSFNNCESRTYDYNDLERQLLGSAT